MKDLKEKAILIKGRQYILVSDRVLFFNEEFPKGSIQTQLISQPNDEMVIIKAIVYPNAEEQNRFFTGYSQAKWNDGYINKTSAIENAETSAVGRALGMMGIGVIESIASADEIQKAKNTTTLDKLQTKLSFEQQVECANKGELKCLICGSPVVAKTTKEGVVKLYCEKDWKHQKFISKAEHQMWLKKAIENNF